ncbi:MAG: hypothetical protein ACQCN6_04230 [Candidatus Bathyarchaeia archaeon]
MGVKRLVGVYFEVDQGILGFCLRLCPQPASNPTRLQNIKSSRPKDRQKKMSKAHTHFI